MTKAGMHTETHTNTLRHNTYFRSHHADFNEKKKVLFFYLRHCTLHTQFLTQEKCRSRYNYANLLTKSYLPTAEFLLFVVGFNPVLP